MASITCVKTSGKVTLSGTTVDTVTVSEAGEMIICNWTGSSDLTVTWGLNGSVPATPVAGAAETFSVPAGMARRLQQQSYNSPMILKVLGDGNVYSVERT